MFADNFGIGFAGVAAGDLHVELDEASATTATQYALLRLGVHLRRQFAKGFSGVGSRSSPPDVRSSTAYGLFFIGAGLLGGPALIFCIVLARAVHTSTPPPTAPR